jgi:prepilin-type N-terminal cleavage/methylation domain-containing protein
MKERPKRANGYSLIELLVATVLFTIIAGTAFSLLFSAQLRYRGESDVTTAFQQANVAIDQITRDVHSAGYPPATSFAAPPAPAPSPQSIALPFSWSASAGYPNAPCTVGVNCGKFPGDYDLILETDTGDGNGVQWIRYSLQGTTLMRGIAKKFAFQDPVNSTTTSLVPYLENVLNGSQSLPIFSYTPDPTVSPVQPSFIQKVNIRLIVQSAQPDPQTQQYRTITLTGQAVRFNPDN